MMAKKFVIIAGIISFLFTLLHLLFPWLFNWKETLAPLDPINWAIFQTFHLIVILMLLMISFLSLRHTEEIIGTTLGRWCCLFFGVFYLLRIVAEFLFFGFNGIESIVIIGLCLIPSLQYLFVFYKRMGPTQISLQNS